MFLAHEFRRPDWRRMLSEMTSSELADWQRYFAAVPFSHRLLDAEFAALSSTMVARFDVRVTRGERASGRLVFCCATERPECLFTLPDAGRYTLTVTAIGDAGQKGEPPPSFSLTPDGKLAAKQADISGTLRATAGELEKVRIRDSCTIEGVLDAKQITGDIYNVQSGGVTLPKGVFSWSDKAGEHVLFKIAGETFDRIFESNLTLTAECIKNRQEFKLIVRHHTKPAFYEDHVLAYADTGNKGKSPGMSYKLNCIRLPAIGRSRVHEIIMVIGNSGRRGGVVCKAPPGEVPRFTAYRAGRQFVTGAER